MDKPNKSKHRESDARWRRKVSRSYEELYHSVQPNSPFENMQYSTRMSTLKLALDHIRDLERKISALGWLSMVRGYIEQAERSAIIHQQ